MNYTRVFFFIFAIPVIATFVSCARPPEGMPKVYPCAISVTNASGGVPEVAIVLHPDTAMGDTVSTGVTGKNGNAKILTQYKNYTTSGAPAGTYIVTVAKEPFLEHTKTPDEIARMDPGTANAYGNDYRAKRDALPRIVPVELTKPSSSPLKLEVTPTGGELKVDLTKF